jgi:D-alanyl-D-alanine carboxypeptidase
MRLIKIHKNAIAKCAALALAAWMLITGCGKEQAASPPAAAKTDPLQKVLNNYRTTNNIVGLSAAVLMPGQDIWLGTSGVSHANVGLRTDMLFRIGSVTKTYVAAVVVRLAEHGVLTLDDTIQDWLPDVQQHLPDPGNIDMTITVRQLLNHSSGIYNYLDSRPLAQDRADDPDKIWTPEELLGYVYSAVFAPGSGFFYTNTGYVLLGMVIEEAAGCDSVSTELDEQIFDVLGFEKSFLAGEVDKPDGSTVAHGWYFSEEYDTEVNMSRYSVSWTAGAMTSTAEETALFLHAIFHGELVNASSLEQMKTTVYVHEKLEYGLGLVRAEMTSGRTLWGHSGHSTGFTAVVLHSPDDDITVAILSNDSNALLEPLVDQLIDAVIENY